MARHEGGSYSPAPSTAVTLVTAAVPKLNRMMRLMAFSVLFANPLFFLQRDIDSISEITVSVAAEAQSQISAA